MNDLFKVLLTTIPLIILASTLSYLWNSCCGFIFNMLIVLGLIIVLGEIIINRTKY